TSQHHDQHGWQQVPAGGKIVLTGSVAPAAFLFRPAWPAVSGHESFTPLWSRQSGGSACADSETTCPQAAWCCGAEEVCSLIGGAFFCCPEGAGSVGCTRVCAAGDFQCGSICCADGQTCMGGDTPSPYCVSQRPTGVPGTAVSTTSISSRTASTYSGISLSITSPSFPAAIISPTSSVTSAIAASTNAASLTQSEQPSPAEPSVTASTTPQHGFSRAAQISIGVIVPVAVVFLVGALWIFNFRRPGRGHARGHRRGEARTTSEDTQAYDKIWLDADTAPHLSPHEKYMMKSNAERRRQGEGERYEMKDLRELEDAGVHGQDATDSGSGGRASPHPGTPVIV
ncbi:hypothetical protein N657DRAFT_562207, partial [Parathielavia appendiculata]